jgi:ubiquinone/menaquinone biosynthesis C-methylase UbiE
MDTPQEALAYDSMDHAEVNRVFVDDFLSAFAASAFAVGQSSEASGADRGDAADRAPVEILDLGTGTAQIPIELCRRATCCRVWAVDLSASMLDVAKAKLEVAGLTYSVRLDLVDAKALPYEAGRFAAVMSNSIIHHVPEPAKVFAEAWRVLAPGGLAFFRDLLRPPDDAVVAHLVDTYAAGATHHQRQLFEDSLRAALSLDELRQLLAESGLDSQAARKTTDRHWTWVTLK